MSAISELVFCKDYQLDWDQDIRGLADLALPLLLRHNSELFSNSFKLPTTALSNIHSNGEIFFNKFSFRSCVVRGNTL